MKGKKNKKIQKVLGKYNYWRQMLRLPFQPKKKMTSGCQVACASDPCQAEPTCEFD